MKVPPDDMRGFGDTFYGPPFPRGGQYLSLALDVLEILAGGQVSVRLEHRDAADTAWSALASFMPASAPGFRTLEATGTKESVRPVYVIGGTRSAEAGGRFTFKVHPPVWRP